MYSLSDGLAYFFGVAFRGQTYLNALYLLLSFPLGLFYFIFLVVGLSVGFPLMIVWVGLVILAAVFAMWYAFIAFEREMAISLLHVNIPPMSNHDLSGKSLWQKFTTTLTNPVTWKGLVYLVAKFPLGTLSFVVLVTAVSLSGSLLAAPFYYTYLHPAVNWTVTGITWNPLWVIDTPQEASLACLVGVFIALISMHVLNGLAWVSGEFARVMLGYFAPAPLAPTTALMVAAAPDTKPEPAAMADYEV